MNTQTHLLSDLQASMLSGLRFHSRVSSSLRRKEQVGKNNKLLIKKPEHNQEVFIISEKIKEKG